MPESDPESYAARLRQDVEDARAHQHDYLSGLAATADEARAVRLSSPFTSSAVPEPAMAVLTDKEVPAGTRVEVLRRLGPALSRQNDSLDALIAIVRDREDDTTVREEALRVLADAAFAVARFGRHQQQYHDALRDLITDPVAGLRETVVSILAQQHDTVAQTALTDGLSGAGPLPVERFRAIALLAEDDLLDNLPRLQEMYAGGTADERELAVRFMGSYPVARPLLEGILRDRAESSEVRQQAGASLRFLAPMSFDAIAKDIGTDPEDDPDVRLACLTALHHLGTDRVFADTAFLGRIRAVSNDESTPQIAAVARALLGHRRDS